MTEPAPTFTDADQPKAALGEALAWLARVVPDAELVRSRNTLQWGRDGVRLEVTFHVSTRSRSGVGTWGRFGATVHDPSLARWRRANPDRSGRSGDLVATFHEHAGGFSLTSSPVTARGLDEVAEVLVAELVPRLDWFRTPSSVVASIPSLPLRDNLIRLMEWATARGDGAGAKALLSRALADAPAMRQIVDEQRRTGVPVGTPGGEALDLIGPAVTRLGVVRPDEPLP